MRLRTFAVATVSLFATLAVAVAENGKIVVGIRSGNADRMLQDELADDGFNRERNPSVQMPGGCADSSDFRLNGKKRRNCKWAGRKRKKSRCNKVDEDTGMKVKQFCRKTCYKNCDEPPPSPSPQPPDPDHANRCFDTEGFAFEGERSKDCDWVKELPSLRCNQKDETKNDAEIRTFCPSVCNKRCTCQDSKKTIPSLDIKCKDVRKQKHCREDSGMEGHPQVRDMCPLKCDYCIATIVL